MLVMTQLSCSGQQQSLLFPPIPANPLTAVKRDFVFKQSDLKFKQRDRILN
jgi:hypothetical protein